jgi:hypothetical protein
MRRIGLLLLFCGLPFPLGCGGQEALGSEDSGRKAASGDFIVYQRLATVDLAEPIPFSGSLQGAKLAFQTKGAEDACFVLHDRSGNKDLRPARQVWKLTGNCPHVPGYQWAGGGWAPCLYRLDLFGQDSMFWRRLQKAPQGTEFAVDFTKPEGPKSTFQVRNLVIYRGDDETPPEAPGRLVARADHEGVHLSWKLAADDVGVAWYVVSRATVQGKFVKVAQTGDTEFTDKPPASGAYRYRVLAVDYERNVGPWSREVAIQAGDGFAPPKPATVARDSLYYAEHVRAVHEAGAGRVVRGSILFHGDCLHYLDRTRNHIAAIASLLSYGCVNESSQVIKPGNPSAKLVKELQRELEFRPEFCVISSGLEDLHPRPFPEDEHTTPEDIRKTVENVLMMVRMCEDRGTVAIVTTLTAFGHNAPKGSPEEKLSDALAKMCRENKVPVARVFDLYRSAQEAGEDYTQLQKPVDKPHPGDVMWSRGYEFLPYEPTFELGISKRIIVVKETIDQVLFTLLDRPDR